MIDLANFLTALASNEDDGQPIDLGGAQGSKPEQSSAEKMVSDQNANKVEDSKGNVTPRVCVIAKQKSVLFKAEH